MYIKGYHYINTSRIMRGPFIIILLKDDITNTVLRRVHNVKKCDSIHLTGVSQQFFIVNSMTSLIMWRAMIANIKEKEEFYLKLCYYI